MKRLSQEWKALVADPFGPTATLQEDKYPVAFSPCCIRFGLGVCVEDLAPDLVSKIDAVARRMNRLVFFRCLRPCSLLVEWLPLFMVIMPADDGGDEFWLLMMVARSKSPQSPVFVDCDITADEDEAGSPVVGTTIKVDFSLHLSNGRMYTDIAEKCSDISQLQIHSLEYDWQTLDTLKVTEVNVDISEHLKSKRSEKATDKDKDFDLVRDWEKVKTDRKRQSKAKSCGSKACAGSSDEELDGGAHVNIPVHDTGNDDEDSASDAEAPAAGAVCDDDDEAFASAVLGFVDEAEQERDALPVWDPASKSVKDCDTGQVIGSIKGLHIGTAKECVSIYCRLHQCSPPLRRIGAAPSNRDILSWFRAGQQECPPGKGGRAAHLRMFKAMCPPAVS